MSEIRKFLTTVASKYAQAPATSAAAASGDAPASATTKVAGKKKKPAKVDTVTFEDDEVDVIEVGVTTGNPGDTGEQMIKDQLVLMQTYIGDYWTSYLAGVENFSDRMGFASEQEAEPHYLNVTLTTVGKTVLDAALDAAGEGLGGPWGAIIGAAKDLVEAWVAESERAAAAAGEADVVKYLNGLRSGIDKSRKEMRDAVTNGTRPLIEEFRRLAQADSFQGQATADGTIVGEAARVVSSVKAGVEAFRKATPSAAAFQQQFSRAYGDTPGLSDNVSHGGVEAGKLYFEIHVYKDLQGKYSVDDSGTFSAWKLVTKQANPERIAASLLESVEGGLPWKIDLEKKVKITVEPEIDWEINPYKVHWIVFKKNPDQYTVNWGDPGLAAEAWKESVTRTRVLGTTKLEGSNG